MDETILCQKCGHKVGTRSAFGVLRFAHHGMVLIVAVGPVTVHCGHKNECRDAAGQVVSRQVCGWPVTLTPGVEVAT